MMIVSRLMKKRHWMLVLWIVLLGCGRSPEQSTLRTANTFLKENQLQAALDTVQSYLAQHPDSRELLRMRVFIFLKREDLDSAANALRSLPKDDPVLSLALRHRDPVVRTAAARFIAQRSGSCDSRDLIRGLEDSIPSVRRYCAESLGLRRDNRAVRPLFRLLHDDNWWVRAEAAKALGRIGDPRAAGWLVRVLDDPDGFVRFSAAVALQELACPANRDLLLTAYSRATEPQRFDIAVALAKLKEPVSLEALTNAMWSADSDQRRRAARALGGFYSRESTNTPPPFDSTLESNQSVLGPTEGPVRDLVKPLGAKMP